MSGGGNSNSGSDGGYIPDSPCEKLKFEAQLTSPQPAVVSTLSIGDVLDITVTQMNGLAVVQVLKGGQLAGGLAGPDATRLRNCIERGHQYHATVRTLNGGQVRVWVEHV